MPKSKKRKTKYAQKRRVAQQPVSTAPKPVEPVSKPVQATVAPTATMTKAKSTAGKTQAIPQPARIGTELRVMGFLTVVLLIAIVALYFVFR
jgi:hypothetical protein